MHQIVFVQPLPQYKVRVVFSDGLKGEVDLFDLVGKGVFKIWEDPKKFAEVSIDPITHTLAWPGGIDLCPDTIYQEIASKGNLSKAPGLISSSRRCACLTLPDDRRGQSGPWLTSP